QQKEINSNEVKQCNLLLLKEGHCLKDHIISVCNMLEKSSKQEFCATSINTLIQMVAGDLGSTLVPAMAVEQLTSQHKTLSVIHLDEPGPHRELVFIFRPNFTRTSSVEALVKLCKEALELRSIK
ncbi:MAG: hydrogen peroxide-inducible genes activator, partial [Alcanivoracaceae bacterium]|nr:hydrogen peroxide-inducible genes activator [Alcanivoracaceae bacterium]